MATSPMAAALGLRTGLRVAIGGIYLMPSLFIKISERLETSRSVRPAISSTSLKTLSVGGFQWSMGLKVAGS